jgi:hypothetical protein
MLHVSIYMKSGAVADFEAESIRESAESHPKFTLDFPPAESGGRRLVYLDRDDVSAVVVEESNRSGRSMTAQEAMVTLPAAIREDVQDVLTVAAAGDAGRPAP